MWIIPSSCFLQLLFVLFISIFSSLPASYRSTVLPFTPSPLPVYHNLYLPPLSPFYVERFFFLPLSPFLSSFSLFPRFIQIFSYFSPRLLIHSVVFTKLFFYLLSFVLPLFLLSTSFFFLPPLIHFSPLHPFISLLPSSISFYFLSSSLPFLPFFNIPFPFIFLSPLPSSLSLISPLPFSIPLQASSVTCQVTRGTLT